MSRVRWSSVAAGVVVALASGALLQSYSVEFDPMYAAFCEAVVTYDADG